MYNLTEILPGLVAFLCAHFYFYFLFFVLGTQRLALAMCLCFYRLSFYPVCRFSQASPIKVQKSSTGKSQQHLFMISATSLLLHAHSPNFANHCPAVCLCHLRLLRQGNLRPFLPRIGPLKHVSCFINSFVLCSSWWYGLRRQLNGSVSLACLRHWVQSLVLKKSRQWHGCITQKFDFPAVNF